MVRQGSERGTASIPDDAERKTHRGMALRGQPRGTPFFSHEVLGRDIYRVLKSQYEVEDPFPLTPLKLKWRRMEIARVPFDPELLERFRDGNATEFLLLPERDR